MATIPEPTIERLLLLTRFLENCGDEAVTSSEIETRTGWSSHTIRKDISYLTGDLSSGSGYSVSALKAAIESSLGLRETRKCCVVGLGRLGSAYLNFPGFEADGFKIVAGFDSSVNRVEILQSPVTLYPSYKMGEVITRFGIELALLCVPASAAQSAADKLVAAGIRGIVNFAPASLSVPANVTVRNVYVVDELRALSARLSCASGAAPRLRRYSHRKRIRRELMKRVYNFSAGPSMLPLSVLERAASEMTNANGSGQSVMEMSHRSKDYKPIIDGAEALLREAMGIPANYKVLFLQGGASLQFSMIPLNLGAPANGVRRRASFVDTGVWATKAAEEAAKYLDAKVVASSKDKSYTYIPPAPAADPADAYYHITLNNTIVGTKYSSIPATGSVPLVADISSCILSEPLDVSKFGLLYAGAQKNLGPAGLTVVIVRDDLIGKHAPETPTMLRYDIQAKEGSMYNTPPCYAIYILGLVLEWMKSTGGVAAMGARNREKAAVLYEYLDSSKLFRSPVVKEFRSLMNIPFVAGDADLEAACVKAAAAEGLVNLAGHRLVGGLRASVYNAMPKEGVIALVDFLKRFEAKNRG